MSVKLDKLKTRIMFIAVTASVGGGEKVLLSILDNLDKSIFYPIVILPGKGKMVDELRRRQIKHYVVKNALGYSMLWPFPFILQVIKFMAVILKESVSIVHINGIDLSRAGVLSAFLTKRKSICHIHSPVNTSEVRYELLAVPDLIICCCEHIKNSILDITRSINKTVPVKTLLNAIDASRFNCKSDTQLKSKLNLPNNGYIITTIGRLCEVKRQKDFLFMAEKVLKKFPDSLFLIIGDEGGPSHTYAEDLKRYAMELGISSRVRFTGFIDDVSDYLSASGVFVLPSLKEGLPLVILEAMACGKPVVATNIDGIPEAVEAEVTGFLVEPKDRTALADRVMRLLSDDVMRNDMGVAAKARADERFGIRDYVGRLQEIYLSILEKKKTFSNNGVKRVLVIALDYIGDYCIRTISVIHWVKRQYPSVEISLLCGTWTSDIARMNPHIKEIVNYNAAWLDRSSRKWGAARKIKTLLGLKRRRYDLIINVRGSAGISVWSLLRPGRLIVHFRDCFVAPTKVGAPRNDVREGNDGLVESRGGHVRWDDIRQDAEKNKKSFITNAPEVKESAKRLLATEGVDLHKKIISIHPYADSEVKRWSASAWAEVIDTMASKYDAEALICGDPSAALYINDIIKAAKSKIHNIAGKTSLSDLIAIIDLSWFCLAIDSGPMHIAGLLDKPVVALFGPNDPATCAPMTDKIKTVYKGLECVKSCVENAMDCGNECMAAITCDDVINAVDELYDNIIH